MEAKSRIEALVENAKKQAETNGVVWDDRMEPWLRNVFGGLLTDIEYLRIPAPIVLMIRSGLTYYKRPKSVAHREALAWLDERYDAAGEWIP